MIEVKGVTKKYEGHTALSDVSFSIPKGQIFGLLGPNGAGKTTLLRLITRMLLPDEGKVLFDGEEIKEEHLKRIGYLPEERGLYPKMQAGEHIHFLSSLKGVRSSLSKEKLTYWAQELALTDLITRKVENLSKGQQQKVQLIASLIHNPDLLILDEPFSGFDPVNAELLKKILFNLKKEGRTIIISTHRMENAEEMCDTVAMVHNGSLVLHGTLKEVLNETSAHYKVFTAENLVSGTTFQVLDKKPGYYLISFSDKSGINETLKEIMGQVQVNAFVPEKKTLKEAFLEKAR